MAQNYVLLERIELNATAASVTFSSIPQTGYTDLKVVISARTTATGNAWQGLYMNLNGSSSSFTYRNLYAVPNTAYSNSGSGNLQGWVDGASATASTFGNTEVYIPNAFGSTYKSISVDTVIETNATANLLGMNASLWSNTAAITSVAFTPEAGSFDVNSTFSLYGIAAVGTTPVVAPKADGGNVIATDGTYWYHTFLTNGTFTPQVGLSADVLVVAGGGAGGGNFAGGGGGGGLLTSSTTCSSSTNYSVTVGAGGAGVTSSAGGGSGNNSVFSSITAIGGGGGAGQSGAASSGGSGGGGSYAYTFGNGTSGQGYNGGTGFDWGPSQAAGGGGGGAGGLGTNSPSQAGGAGGIGVTSSISGSSVNYAGGGGGGLGTAASGTAGSASYGGGAGSKGSANATAGTVNTGGGGGGRGEGSGTYSSGNGGSGIVIIRYAV